nr:immunoglobulin heavy chain junction region [Macaca mulatta]MOV38716.1 immunoglobulin heavy chain junction region [Macaca mulatta]MOV38955.1 immunoglobulin heavy chain junction region [Macaca mulatta]MOV39362.1 immunoglobulin heavy chain junction region [Macaca mulatta]MOV39397.1 immunoglobulin heavy chain junction region [Macaca mulatta]
CAKLFGSGYYTDYFDYW